MCLKREELCKTESIPWAAACRAVLRRSTCSVNDSGEEKCAVLERRAAVVSPSDAFTREQRRSGVWKINGEDKPQHGRYVNT